MRRVLAVFLVLVGCSGTDDGKGDGGSGLPPGERCVPLDPTQPLRPVVQYEEVSFEGWPILRYVPPNPIGLLYYFHGTGGNTAQVQQLEPMGAVNVLVESGFALLATQSEERGEVARWSDEPSWELNPDYQRLDALRADLIASGGITDDTPVYAMGFSDGGGTAPLFAGAAMEQGWPFGAVAPHNSVGRDAPPGLPMFFVESENDEQVSVETAEANYNARLEGGWPAEYRLTVESPLDPLRFLRIPGYTEETSQNAFTELGVFGLIDDKGVRLIDLVDLESELGRFEANANSPTAFEVVAQMRVVWASHRFSNEFIAEECQFFLDHRP